MSAAINGAAVLAVSALAGLGVAGGLAAAVSVLVRRYVRRSDR